MGQRLAVLISAGALALSFGLPARAAEKTSISYPNQAAKAAQPLVIQGRLNVLETTAEQLDLSDGQRVELQSLLQKEHEQVAALHQDLNSSDAQKGASFRQIRQQTKNNFVAVLTPEQRREFNRMMGR